MSKKEEEIIEEVKTPAPESVEEPLKRKTKTLKSGATFHDFEDSPIYEGFFTGELVIAEKDNEEASRKKGDVMGYLFENLDGEETIIGNSNAIEKVIPLISAGDQLIITFKGKVVGSNGRPYNRFKIELVETDVETD
jgi:hypothetical protein